jgi:DNA-binding response OmpR family regulator
MANARRILVVDDETDTLGLVELTLQTAGYQVASVPSGEQAIQAVQHDTFDLILLDIMMPDMSGYDVFKRLKEAPTAPPPVIFLTAKTRPEDRETGESLGAAAFLTKPVTRGQLLDVIRNVLSGTAGASAPS